MFFRAKASEMVFRKRRPRGEAPLDLGGRTKTFSDRLSLPFCRRPSYALTGEYVE